MERFFFSKNIIKSKQFGYNVNRIIVIFIPLIVEKVINYFAWSSDKLNSTIFSRYNGVSKSPINKEPCLDGFIFYNNAH